MRSSERGRQHHGNTSLCIIRQAFRCYSMLTPAPAAPYWQEKDSFILHLSKTAGARDVGGPHGALRADAAAASEARGEGPWAGAPIFIIFNGLRRVPRCSEALTPQICSSSPSTTPSRDQRFGCSPSQLPPVKKEKRRPAPLTLMERASRPRSPSKEADPEALRGFDLNVRGAAGSQTPGSARRSGPRESGGSSGMALERALGMGSWHGPGGSESGRSHAEVADSLGCGEIQGPWQVLGSLASAAGACRCSLHCPLTI